MPAGISPMDGCYPTDAGNYPSGRYSATVEAPQQGAEGPLNAWPPPARYSFRGPASARARAEMAVRCWIRLSTSRISLS
jgi:hypothetical protein